MEHSLTRSRARSLLTPRWIVMTLLVIIAVGVMIRLGFWQLDRLKQRRAFNAAVEAQVSAPPLNLNADLVNSGTQPNDLLNMEYRPAVVTGTYDPAHQVILRNQVANNLPGYHLLTPLKINGTQQAVLVDRGFIPMDEKTPASWSQYNRPGVVTVKGSLRLGHVPKVFGVADPALAPGQTRLDAWNNLDLPRIQAQTPYTLLPVYLQAAPEAAPSAANGLVPATGAASYPIAGVDQPDLTEGPHMGYAIQWFSFAAIFAIGYPFLIRRQLKQPEDARLKQPEDKGKKGGEHA